MTVLLYTADNSELAHLARCPANRQNQPSLAGYSLIIPCPLCIAHSLWILFFLPVSLGRKVSVKSTNEAIFSADELYTIFCRCLETSVFSRRLADIIITMMITQNGITQYNIIWCIQRRKTNSLTSFLFHTHCLICLGVMYSSARPFSVIHTEFRHFPNCAWGIMGCVLTQMARLTQCSYPLTQPSRAFRPAVDSFPYST